MKEAAVIDRPNPESESINMSITREQVADLQPGDVVEIRDQRWGPEAAIRGPVCETDKRPPCLTVCGVVVRWANADPGLPNQTLTVVSRAPRPLYVNHPRTEPVPGDVVRDADNESDKRTWCTDDDDRLCWQRLDDGMANFYSRAELPARLRLLVDGTSGQVVTS